MKTDRPIRISRGLFPHCSLAIIPRFLATLMLMGLANAKGIPSPRFAQGDLLVKFRGGPHSSAAEHARDLMKHEVKRNFDFIGWQHIRLPAGMSVQEGLAQYKALPGVVAVEPNYIQQPIDSVTESTSISDGLSSAPNDPRFKQQWGHHRIGAPDMWNVTTGSSNVVV